MREQRAAAMKLRRARRPVARGRGGMSGQRVLKAEAALAGGVVLAFLCWEIPSLRREMRLWRMAGGFRAGHRYP
ncbi:hypothetical protein SVIOM74S_07334 [Streptomyces violarus]